MLHRLLHPGPRAQHHLKVVGLGLIVLAFLVGVYRIEGLIRAQGDDVRNQRAGFRRSEAAECIVLQAVRLNGILIRVVVLHSQPRTPDVVAALRRIDALKVPRCDGPGGTFGP